jgi:hypothetical protein
MDTTNPPEIVHGIVVNLDGQEPAPDAGIDVLGGRIEGIGSIGGDGTADVIAGQEANIDGRAATPEVGSKLHVR